MAKKKNRSTGSRRVSGTGKGKTKDVLTNGLLLIGGAVAGKLVTNFASKQFGDKVTPEIAAAGQIVVGAFLLPKFLKGTTGQMLGYGMMVNGGLTLAEKLKLPGMSGLGQLPVIGSRQLPRRVAGTDNPTMNNSMTQRMAVIGELERGF